MCRPYNLRDLRTRYWKLARGRQSNLFTRSRVRGDSLSECQGVADVPAYWHPHMGLLTLLVTRICLAAGKEANSHRSPKWQIVRAPGVC